MTKRIILTIFALFSVPAVAQNLPACHLGGEYQTGYECLGNNGRVFSFQGDSWVTSKGETWLVTGQRARFDDAKTLCKQLGARVPSVWEFNALNTEIKNPRTGLLPELFPIEASQRRSEDQYWTADAFSSALGYIWHPRTGNTNGRYYIDYDYLVVCKK